MRSPTRVGENILLALPVVAAALLAGYTSTHGLNDDQLMTYEGAMRAASGQAAFRDYSPQHGPLASWLGGLVFALAPTGGTAWVLCSALLNAVATWLVMALTRRAGASRGATAIAGALTAIWFLPPFGSYYNDHLAYALLLGAALAFLRGKAARTAHAWFALAGALVALAYHAKQTVGTTGALSLVVAACLSASWPALRRPLATMVAALLTTHALILLFIARHGLDFYARYAILYPMRYAAASTDKRWWRLVSFVVAPWHYPAFLAGGAGAGRLAFLPVALAAYAVLAIIVSSWRSPRADDDARARWFALLFFTLSTLWGAAWLGRLYLQLFFGMGGALALAWTQLSGSRALPRWGLSAAAVVIGAAGLAYSIGNATRAREWDAFLLGTDLKPVRVAASPASGDVRRLVEYLGPRPGNVMVLGGVSHLVAAALRRPPLQPTLFDSPGLNVPQDARGNREYNADLVRVLEGGRVDYVIADRDWNARGGAKPTIAILFERYEPSLQSGRLAVLSPRKAPLSSVTP